jgi:hypothetical protein
MPTPPVAHQPYLDADALPTQGPTVVAGFEEAADPLGPARGILISVALVAPFWIALLLMLL